MSLLFPPEFQLHKTYFHPAAGLGKRHCPTPQLYTRALSPAKKPRRGVGKAAFGKRKILWKGQEIILIQTIFPPWLSRRKGCSLADTSLNEESGAGDCRRWLHEGAGHGARMREPLSSVGTRSLTCWCLHSLSPTAGWPHEMPPRRPTAVARAA